jgi:hypothetical protein
MGADRGSDRMMQERMERRTFSQEQLQQLVELSRKDGVELRDIWIYGQPDPDVVSGTFDVNPDNTASLVQDLLNQEIRFRLEMFPLGIPFPEIIRIDFGSRGLNRT